MMSYKKKDTYIRWSRWYVFIVAKVYIASRYDTSLVWNPSSNCSLLIEGQVRGWNDLCWALGIGRKSDKKNNQFISVNNQIHFTPSTLPHGQGEYMRSIATYLIKQAIQIIIQNFESMITLTHHRC